MKKINKINLEIYQRVRLFRDNILATPCKFLIKLGVNANMISIFRLFLTIPLLLLAGNWPLWAVLILLINFFLDSLDGVVARLSKSESRKGRALDVCIDNFYVLPLVLGLILANLVFPFWAALYVLVILIHYFVNYLKFGIDVGNYPFSFSKYFIYAALLVFGIGMGNYYDVVIIFWSIFLLIEDTYLIFNLYHGNNGK